MGKKSDKEKPTGSGSAPDVVNDIEFNINELVEQYINTLNRPEDLTENNGLFVGMLKYIYNNGYSNRYDYGLLDKLFYIYTDLVYRYKKNKQPYILEYCIFVNVDRTVLYNVRNGVSKKATLEDIHNVKRWFTECENALLNTDTVGAIFRLKSMYGYNDNLAPVHNDGGGAMLSVDQLPDLKTEKLPDKGRKQIPKKS